MYEEKLIPGKQLAEKINNETKAKVAQMAIKPKLAIILASHDQASEMYVKMKTKIAINLGIETELFKFENDVTKAELIKQIEKLNSDQSIKGILLQLPLYNHLSGDTTTIVNTIAKEKDVDGLKAAQQGAISALIEGSIPPAVVEATLEALNYCIKEDFTWENILNNHDQFESLKGLNILIVNNTILIGKPLALILSSVGATVTIANVYTKNIKDISRNSDVIISATNQTALFDHNDIKEGSILVDITSVNKDGKVLGDFVQSEELMKKCRFISPVPGGIGPMTIACLLRNLI